MDSKTKPLQPVIKGAAFVIIIMLLASLLGCEKPDLPPAMTKHYVKIDPSNLETFIFGDFQKDSLRFPDRTIPNGYVFADGSSYTFTVSGKGKIGVKMGIQPNNVKHYTKATGGTLEILEPSTAGNYNYIPQEHSYLIIEYALKE